MVKIRDAREEELPYIRAQRVISYEEHARKIPAAHWEALKKAISSDADLQPGAEIIVAELDGKIAGSVVLFPAKTDAYEGFVDELDYPEIRMLAVATEFRGLGAATALIVECMDRAKAMGYSSIGLHTGQFMEDAMRLYERLGFQRLPQYDFEPANDGIMVRAYRLVFPMKSALILGGTQFVGKRLVQLLLDEGVEVTIATRGKTADPFGDRVTRLIIDREDAQSLNQAFHAKEWDVVYDQTCYSSQEAHDTLQALEGKVKKYIFTSSQAVYDFGTSHKEDSFEPTIFQPVLKNRREYIGYVGYQEAKRAAEAILFQQATVPVVAVRFSIIVGQDDYTNRLKFHVDHVTQGKPMLIEHPDFRYSFIDSQEAAQFLYTIAKSDYSGPINPGSSGDISLGELVTLIETITETKAALSKEGAPSPYNLPGSWSTDTSLVESLGYRFTPLNQLLEELVRYYSR